MTFREKLKMEHPERINPDAAGGCVGCPALYGYEDRSGGCCHKHPGDLFKMSCTDCWNREIPGTEPTSRSDGFNPDQTSKPNSYEKIASELHSMYTAFRNSGFTDEQALTLTKSMIAAGVALTKN